MLNDVLLREGFEVLSGTELRAVRSSLDGLFRPDIVVRSHGETIIVESTTWANPDKLRADFFKGYVAAKKGYRLVCFVAGLEASISDTDPGFQRVVAVAMSDRYVRGVWGIRSLRGLVTYLQNPPKSIQPS